MSVKQAVLLAKILKDSCVFIIDVKIGDHSPPVSPLCSRHTRAAAQFNADLAEIFNQPCPGWQWRCWSWCPLGPRAMFLKGSRKSLSHCMRSRLKEVLTCHSMYRVSTCSAHQRETLHHYQLLQTADIPMLTSHNAAAAEQVTVG